MPRTYLVQVDWLASFDIYLYIPKYAVIFQQLKESSLAQWKRGMSLLHLRNNTRVLTHYSRAHNPEVTGSKPVAAMKLSFFAVYSVDAYLDR